MLGKQSFDVVDDAAHLVEADAAESHLGLDLAAGLGDHDDRFAGVGDAAGVLSEASVQGDVDGATEVAGRGTPRRSTVDGERAPRCATLQPGAVEDLRGLVVIEQPAVTAVASAA